MTENELRARVCALADRWVGKKESNGTHREIIDIYNRIVPLPRGYRMTYNDPWCAATVSAIGYACGLSQWIFPECGCNPMIELYRKAGRWMEDDAYLPAPGDVIFYDWQDSGVGDNLGASDHVGIVIGVSGSVINIIEGNCGNAVQYTAREVNGRYIRGYGLPDYAAAAAELSEDEPVGDDAPGSPDSGVIVIPDPEPVPVPDTPEPVKPPELSEGWCYVALPVLVIGDESEAVRAAQTLLEKRGFKCGWMGCDGEFGPKTEAALGKFKRDRDLERNPEIDAETWQRLICG